MTDTFDPESKKALIDYRIERAYETLKEAKYNYDGGFTTQQSTECTMPVSML